MSDISTGLIQLGFGAFGVLAAVCACCLGALAVAQTKRVIRELR